MSEFAAAIGLSDNWPINVENDDEMGVSGLLIWALAYFRAAEQLHFSDANVRQTPYYSGPIMQNVGLATELTLKAMLYGCGKTMDELRNYSHNTYNAYCDARACFDEVKFIDLHISCTSYMTVPAEVRSRYAEQGKEDVDIRWRVYFDHLRLLDSVYDRPYRSRYITAGLVLLPETEIVLIGTKILLSAMEERLK